ncbi:nucleotide disphospho-sugar-binding domain-containing protein [Streptomyces sp. NPDC101151]|uniref:nucleotide disphospho-sugar-binding domain-containing protein n=1 Tax=Streptomyces sp. NPDC101151 TaxID=3366115 RepID=UPI0038099E68
MKFLFITTGSQATFYAVAPLATAARNAGHQVLLAAHEPWMDTVEAIGVPTISYASKPIRYYMKNATTGGLRFPKELGDEEMTAQGHGFAKMASAGLGSLLELTENWTPDIVIGSSMSYVAGLLATHLKVPYVRQIEYLSIPITGIDPGAADELQPELKELGLTGLPEPALLIDATPPSLRPTHDPTAQPVRWIPSNPQRRLEPWMYTKPTGRHRVLITSGFRSLMFRDPGWNMPLLVNQLTQAGAEVLIAASPGAAEKFGTQLGDARVGWIPVDVTAPTCDLAIHHGGGTTATTFATNAVPQLIIPENPPEFPENYHRHAIARALTDQGTALTLMPQQQAPDQNPGHIIATTAQELLNNPHHTHQAQTLATEIHTLPTPADLIPTLETLTTA